MLETQPSPPPLVELQSEAAASVNAAPKRRARGLEIQGLIDKNGGKLLVPLPQEHRAPVGFMLLNWHQRLAFLWFVKMYKT